MKGSKLVVYHFLPRINMRVLFILFLLLNVLCTISALKPQDTSPLRNDHHGQKIEPLSNHTRPTPVRRADPSFDYPSVN